MVDITATSPQKFLIVGGIPAETRQLHLLLFLEKIMKDPNAIEHVEVLGDCAVISLRDPKGRFSLIHFFTMRVLFPYPAKYTPADKIQLHLHVEILQMLTT